MRTILTEITVYPTGLTNHNAVVCSATPDAALCDGLYIHDPFCYKHCYEVRLADVAYELRGFTPTGVV